MQFRDMTLVAALASASVMWAQTAQPTGPTTQEINAQNANNVCRIYFSMPKPGATQQYEEGRKKHMQFHRAQKDTWTWRTYAIETGDNAGMYVTSSCNHAWKDFDEWETRMGKPDTADGAVNLTPHVQGGRNGFYVYRADMSLAPANQPPMPITAVTVYVLRPGTGPDFVAAMRKVGDVLRKDPNWPKTSGWLQLINGGEGPVFVLLSGRKNWADLAPLPKSAVDLTNEALGKEAADALFKTIRESTARIFTEAAKYRPDLSYEPGR
jgi:hypothetical protein